jgi:hypothetical protein
MFKGDWLTIRNITPALFQRQDALIEEETVTATLAYCEENLSRTHVTPLRTVTTKFITKLPAMTDKLISLPENANHARIEWTLHQLAQANAPRRCTFPYLYDSVYSMPW